jgi:hypothetical protein
MAPYLLTYLSLSQSILRRDFFAFSIVWNQTFTPAVGLRIPNWNGLLIPGYISDYFIVHIKLDDIQYEI